MIRRVLTILFNLLIFLTLSAQVTNQASTESEGSFMLHKARAAYNHGQFDKAIDILKGVNISGDDLLAADVYHLMALCHIELGDKKSTEQDILKMIQKNPYYTVSSTENPLIASIVQKRRNRSATIVTASQQAESIDESPVPVTLITREMIESSCANTIQDLLLQYVPGMTKIEGLEPNIAMRGTYSQTQEDILILLDGHRLNSYSTNVEAPDYRTSIDKIDHIEVLRGPASSLYGNVALTGVVNIITRKGNEVNGNHISLKYGSNNSIGVNFLRGRGGFRTDNIIWASIYSSNGEKTDYSPQNNGYSTKSIINGYRDIPSFDIGTRIRWEDVTLTTSIQHSKRIPYENFFQIDGYTYSRYKYDSSTKPGTSRTSINIMGDYSHTWKNMTLTVSLQTGYERSTIYNVLCDTTTEQVVEILLAMCYLPTAAEIHTSGLWETLAWQGFSTSANASCAYTYTLGRQKGSILGGIQFDFYIPTQGSFTAGYDYDKVHYILNDAIYTSKENTASAFLQLKHRFTDKIIFNGGLRFDQKNRYDKTTLSKLSPRISFIWLLNKHINIRASYAQSYVDAPFLYRACKLDLINGTLQPQNMSTTQIGFAANWPEANIKWEINGFYNKTNDLVILDGVFNLETGNISGNVMNNSGRTKIGGIESILSYQRPSTIAALNITYQQAFKYQETDSIEYNYIINVPEFTANLTLAQKVINTRKWGGLWVRANCHAQSSVQNNAYDMMTKMTLRGFNKYVNIEYNESQEFVCTANAGIEWRTKHINIGIDVYNIFNTQYHIGSRSNSPQPQQSRHFLAKASFYF